MTEGAPSEPERRNHEHRHHHEKEEEKRGEKNEKSRNEKNWEEKWRRDPVHAITWAAILIWAGLALLAETSGWGYTTFGRWNTWAVIMAGAGAILILAALIRLMKPEHRRPILGGLILGFVFLGVGLSEMTDVGWGLIGGIVLIVIGITIISRGIFHQRR
jgi:hypothetical protein